jgi:hypothetical protein
VLASMIPVQRLTGGSAPPGDLDPQRRRRDPAPTLDQRRSLGAGTVNVTDSALPSRCHGDPL